MNYGSIIKECISCAKVQNKGKALSAIITSTLFRKLCNQIGIPSEAKNAGEIWLFGAEVKIVESKRIAIVAFPKSR